MGKFKALWIFVFICVLINSLSGVIGGYLIKPALNNYIIPMIGAENPDFTGFARLLLGVLVLFLVGAIHFWLTSYMDKIRVRQIYTSLILLTLYTILLLAVQPQMYNVLIYMLTIAVSPIIAHFVSLTRTRMSNIFFFVLMATILILTGMNLWIS